MPSWLGADVFVVLHIEEVITYEVPSRKPERGLELAG